MPTQFNHVNENRSKPKMIKIAYLSDYPEYVDGLVQWNYDAWHKYDPSLTMERSKKAFEERKLNYNKIPLTIIALDENIPNDKDRLVGTVTLKGKIPVPGYEDKTPWLGGLCILDSRQNQGIGSKLMTKICDIAKNLNYKEFFLFTSVPSMPEWYLKHDWKILQQDTYPKGNPEYEHPITIMHKYL